MDASSVVSRFCIGLDQQALFSGLGRATQVVGKGHQEEVLATVDGLPVYLDQQSRLMIEFGPSLPISLSAAV